MAGDLLPGENLILKVHQHWIFVAKSLLIPIALLLLTVVADILIGSGTHIRTPLTLAVVAIALLWLIVVWIRWQSITYTLTDQRIKLVSGIFSRQEKIIPIDRNQDCTTKQSLVGSAVFGQEALGFGDVKLVTFIGAVVGVYETAIVTALFLGVLFAGVISLLLVALRIRSMKDAIPYGPFLAAGALVVLYRLGSQ